MAPEGRKWPEQELWNVQYLTDQRPRFIRHITQLNEVGEPNGLMGYLRLKGHQGSRSLISNSKKMGLLGEVLEMKVLRNKIISKAFPLLNCSRFLPTTEARCILTALCLLECRLGTRTGGCTSQGCWVVWSSFWGLQKQRNVSLSISSLSPGLVQMQL